MKRPKVTAVVRVPDGWLGMSGEARRDVIAAHLEALAVLVRNNAAELRPLLNPNGNTTRVKVEG